MSNSEELPVSPKIDLRRSELKRHLAGMRSGVRTGPDEWRCGNCGKYSYMRATTCPRCGNPQPRNEAKAVCIVSRLLEDEPFIYQCAWCKQIKQPDGTYAPGTPAHGRISHGVCPSCKLKWEQELDSGKFSPLSDPTKGSPPQV